MDTARLDLINSHVDLEIEMNAQLDENRFTQFIDPWTDAAYEMRIIAVDILEAKSLEEDYDWMAWLTETRRLKEDYARMVWSIEDQLVECKAAVQSALSKEQYEVLTENVEIVRLAVCTAEGGLYQSGEEAALGRGQAEGGAR